MMKKNILILLILYLACIGRMVFISDAFANDDFSEKYRSYQNDVIAG